MQYIYINTTYNVYIYNILQKAKVRINLKITKQSETHIF